MEETQHLKATDTLADKTISEPMRDAMKAASFIRRMFEEGNRLKAEHGVENVHDFSLGNPSAPPPKEFFAALEEVAKTSEPADHRYMTNAGRLDTRKFIAEQVGREQGLAIGPEHVVMSTGAAGALNVLLKSVLEPQDEVLLLVPYFSEYLFYIQNHQGVPKSVPTGPDFAPDLDALRASLTDRTRALILNTPNNPSGVCYRPETVEAIGAIIDEHAEKVGRPVYLMMDEPYRRIRYTEVEHPRILSCCRHGVLVTSCSKELGLAGERIGYAVLNPRQEGVQELADAMAIATRILGFVNAPAVMQRVLPLCGDAAVDITPYRENRDLLVETLLDAGYRMPPPEGAFFLFPEAPGGDDIAFCDALRARLVLTVPGRGFGAPGHIRISYAVPRETVEKALPAFREVIAEFTS